MTAGPARSADFIVVGAGTAGCVVARRLLDQTAGTVLVLEGGNHDAELDSVTEPSRWVENVGADHDWNYTYEPSAGVAGRRTPLSRGKLVGGSGSTNALAWVLGHRADFDQWAALGLDGWDYESVLSAFRRAENWSEGPSALRGTSGPLHVEKVQDLHPVSSAFIDACQSFGMRPLPDPNVPEPMGVGPMNLTVRDGRRASTWTSYLEPVERHDRLTLITGARAIGLVFEAGRCSGIRFIKGGRVETAWADAEIILTAGAIDTPRLMMLSGIGPADHLSQVGVAARHALPGVGRNLQEHPLLAGVCFSITEPVPPPTGNLSGSTAFWPSKQAQQVPDILFNAKQYAYASPEVAAHFAVPCPGFSIAPGLMTVQSRGTVDLRGPGPDDGLVVRANMLSHQSEVDALVEAVEISLELGRQPALAALGSQPVIPGADRSRNGLLAFVRMATMPYFHPVGTCAMGNGSEAVVDARLRVHGIDGLRVADASVMPTITSANTNAPTVVIAERAADFITSTWNEGAQARQPEIQESH